MNIFENKRAVGLTSVFALAFAGLMAWGFAKKSEADSIIKEATAAEAGLRTITSSALPPKKETRSALNAATKEINAQVKLLNADLAPYVNTCKDISKDALSKEQLFHPEHLRAARNWLNKIASASGTQLPAGDAFTFGLDRNFNERNDAATPETTPFLIYQLNAARTLAGYVAQAGAVSLERMYCEPVPSEEEGDITPIHIELSFTVKRGNIPSDAAHTSAITQVLNAILEGKGEVVSRNEEKKDARFFFIVKGINVNSNNSYGTADPYSEPFQTAGDEGAQATSIAQQKVGMEDETAYVNLIVEAVYFSQNAN